MGTQTSTAVNVARDHINAWVIKIGKKQRNAGNRCARHSNRHVIRL